MEQPQNPHPLVRGLRNVLKVLGLDSAGRRLFHRLQPSRRNRPPPPPSETSKCRARLAPFCAGYGLDLGFGGDPIVPHAIGMDMPQPYSDVGKLPVQLGGDATRLVWFADGTLDFVFSSHLLEDFVAVGAVLREWLRVLKPGGRLIIFCPDEQVYRRHCAATGQPYNTHHVHADFSLAYVKRELARLGVPHRVLHEAALIDVYSWEIVVEKLAPTPHG
ncbi:MAG: class I SAM-dependent methyltransferase [Verrucomicrobia bacterium]|nr:class I SAM-dependent methyltransferase [Verrucomicrobiota bacterium]